MTPPGLSQAHFGVLTWSPQFVDAHREAVEAQHGLIGAHSGVIETHLAVFETHRGIGFVYYRGLEL